MGDANGRLPSGTGVVISRPDLQGMRADVVSHDFQTGRCHVKLRGAPEGSAYQAVGRGDLCEIESGAECRGNEDHRREILKRATEDDAPRHILDRSEAIDLADRIGYALLSNPKELSPSVTFPAHVLLIREYYISQTWTIPLPKFACAKAILSLKGYIDRTTEDPFHIANFEARIAESLDGGLSDETANILLGAVVYAIVKMNESSVEGITSKIKPLRFAYRLLTDETSSTLLARVRAAVDREFASRGAPDFSYKHLLWCICCLDIQLSKEIRVRYPGCGHVRSPDYIDVLVECAKMAVRVRPDSPHSYFVGSYLLTDTQNMCRPSDCHPRYQLACQYALAGLEKAEACGDPFYLYQCHILVAYWKMTSAYKRPYTQREIRNHLERAEDCKSQCRDYTVKLDLHRGSQSRKYVLSALKSFKRLNPTYDDDDVVPGAITLAPFEETNPGPDVLGVTAIPGTEKGGRLDRHADKYLCAYCRKTTPRLLKCSRCGVASYCNKDCQTAHWRKGHRKECVKKR